MNRTLFASTFLIALVLEGLGLESFVHVHHDAPGEAQTLPMGFPIPGARTDHDVTKKVIVVDEVVITIPRRRSEQIESVWICGPWRESQVGGGYRECGWK
jgi:hypothetical protein